MNCKTCKFAEWKTTKSGRLHPSGDGRCACPIKMPTLPAAFYWIGNHEPKPSGGYLDRHKAEKYNGCQRWAAKS